MYIFPLEENRCGEGKSWEGYYRSYAHQIMKDEVQNLNLDKRLTIHGKQGKYNMRVKRRGDTVLEY